MRLILISALFSLLTVPVMAASQCYQPEELRAEQLLRLHSELMVITVTCRKSSVGEDLVPKYTRFTKNNIKALHDAEQTLIHYYKANAGNGISQLDKLRTKLGNEYGQEIADASAPLFCGERRDKVVALYKAAPEKIELEVDRMVDQEHSYVSACSSGRTRIAKHNK